MGGFIKERKKYFTLIQFNGLSLDLIPFLQSVLHASSDNMIS